MLRKHFRQLRAKNTAIPAVTAPITPNKDVIKAIFFTATQTCHIQSLYSVMIDKQRKTGLAHSWGWWRRCGCWLRSAIKRVKA